MKLQWVTAITIALISSANLVLAQDWINPSGGSWQDAANWSGNAVPTAGSTTQFILDQNYAVNLSSSVEADLFTTDRITLNLNGNGFDGQVEVSNEGAINFLEGAVDSRVYTNNGRVVFNGFTTSYNGDIFIGQNGQAIFSGGASGQGYIDPIGQGGQLTVDGFGTSVNNVISFVVRENAKIQVTGGGFAKSSAYVGAWDSSLLVSGTGSEYMTNGGYTNGSITVTDGGEMKIDDDFLQDGGSLITISNGGKLVMGRLRDSLGARGVVVTGTGSELRVTDTYYELENKLTVADGGVYSTKGDYGSNFLDVQDGGVLDANGGTLELGEAKLSIQQGGEAKIRNGSRLEANAIYNRGKLTINGNSEVVNEDGGGSIWLENTHSGEVQGSFSGDIYFTNYSEGKITIESGDKMAFLSEERDSANEGVIEITGGTLQVAESLFNFGGSGNNIRVEDGAIQAEVFLNRNRGRVEFFGDSYFEGDALANETLSEIVVYTGITSIFGDLENDGDIAVADDAALKIYGDLTGSGNFLGTGTVEILGDLLPGNSPGTLSFAGDVVLGEDTNLVLEIGGLNPSEYDFLDIAGTLYADGSITFSFIDGFIPEAGDSLELIEFASFVGDFDQINFLGLTPDQIDILMESIGGSGLSLTAVPEPASGSLLLAGLGAWLWRRRRAS